MTTKSDFPEDEWARIVRAPFVAGLAISLADPVAPSRRPRSPWRRSRLPPTRPAASSC